MAFPLKVLAATDLSEPADEAIRQAHAWSEASGADLAVAHVIPNPLRANPFFPQLNEELALAAAALEQRAARNLARRVEALTGRTSGGFEARVDQGDPLPALLDLAEGMGADLLVVGSHGSSGVPRLLLGSVGERLVRYAHCSVLVARPFARSGRVLATTDLSEASLPAVSLAAQVARRAGAHLTVLHAVDAGESLAAYVAMSRSGPALAALQEAGRRARNLAEASLAGTLRRLEVQAEAVVEEGPAIPAILRAADRLQAELVVLGTHGRTGLARLALGSVTESVVRAASGPVLAVRWARR